MYYNKNNLYINKYNKVLFDLNNLDTYELNDKYFEIFKNIYYKNNQLENMKNTP